VPPLLGERTSFVYQSSFPSIGERSLFKLTNHAIIYFVAHLGNHINKNAIRVNIVTPYGRIWTRKKESSLHYLGFIGFIAQK
jgi:hypothetical protein